MRSLPLLLLLAGARVEGRQEGKNHLGERQLLLKQANCSQLLDTFSESSSNFTRWNDQRGWPAFTTHSLGRCANQYAQPIFMCRKCLDYYLTVIEIYDALRHRWVKSLSYGGRGISSISGISGSSSGWSRCMSSRRGKGRGVCLQAHMWSSQSLCHSDAKVPAPCP